MRHKFYLPIGMPSLGSEPIDPQPGDTYFDNRSNYKKVRTWDGTKWTSGGGMLTAGKGLSGGGSTADDVVLNVGQGPGILVGDNDISLDLAVTSGLYVKRAGDTMTGRLGLSFNPEDAMEAVNKGYVDVQNGVTRSLAIGAGNGLGGGGALSTQPSLYVIPGNGILISGDAVTLNTTYTDGRYAFAAHNHGYSLLGHTHTAAQASVTGAVRTIGRIPPIDEGGGVLAKTVAHGHGSRPTVLVAMVTGDAGQHSVTVSADTWDATNVALRFRNFNKSTGEEVNVAIIAIH